MSQKFRAKAKRTAASEKASLPGKASAPEQAGNIGKLKIIGFLVLATGLAGGVYIAAAKANLRRYSMRIGSSVPCFCVRPCA